MKKLFSTFTLLLFLSLGINSCTSTEVSPNTTVEGNIDTTASSDNFADIGNKIWIDSNKDGIKQRPESGFANIVVNLYKDANKDAKPDGAIFKTDTTDKGGYYRFDALDPSINYLIEVIAPKDYTFSSKHNSSAQNKDYDSDINPSTGLSDSLDVLKGRYFYWIDAALQPAGDVVTNPASVGDKVWLDANKDGIKQSDESGLKDIVLNLWLDSNNDNKPDKEVTSTKTNSSGNYQFKNLNPSLSYYIELELPTSYKVSQKHNSDAKGKDWDNDFNSNAYTDKLNLEAGKFNYWLADGAIYKGTTNPGVCVDPVTIPDPNFERIIKATLAEKPVTCKNLAEIKTIWHSGKRSSRKVSDISGIEYLVNLEQVKLDYAHIVDLTPLKDLKKLWAIYFYSNDIVDVSALASVTSLTTLGLGGNQIKDISPIANLVKINSLDLRENLITDISSLKSLKLLKFLRMDNELNKQGNTVKDISVLKNFANMTEFHFTNNNIEDISVLLELPKLYSAGLIKNCLDTSSGSNDMAVINTLLQRNVKVSYNDQKTCSTSQKVEIASYAWIDYNKDGIRQIAEEYGSLGFVLNLWQDTNNDGKADKKIATTKTSFRGYYQFKNLDINKNYFIEVELPDGYTIAQKHNTSAPSSKVDSDFNLSSHFTDKLVLPELDLVEGLAGAALIKPETAPERQASIGDLIWDDVDKDGVRDDQEHGIKGIVVNLYRDINKDNKADYGVYKTLTSEDRGYYRFLSLDPDINYIVEVIVDSNHGFAQMHNPDAPSKYYDSDINPNTGRSTTIDLAVKDDHHWIDAAIISTGTSNECKDPVTIPDPVLKETFEDDLQTITCAGLASLTKIDYSGQGTGNPKIKDLTGLRFAKNLEVLRLDHNSISDISEIKYLTKLHTLTLDHNNINDISALSTLTELKNLDFWSNKVSNIDALQSLKNLTYLKFHFNQVTNIDALAELNKLQSVSLYNNKIQNISKTLNLPKITQFSFGGNEMKDISGLSGLVNVVKLGLHGNKIVDISVLASLPKIEKLYLSGNTGLTDLSALASLKKLTLLYLNNVKPSDISFLSHTNLLETISMQESGLTDISVFEDLAELHLVMIQKNKITDISPIIRIEGIDGGIVRIYENCLDISSGQDLADINNLLDRGVTVNYTPQNNCE